MIQDLLERLQKEGMPPHLQMFVYQQYRAWVTPKIHIGPVDVFDAYRNMVSDLVADGLDKISPDASHQSIVNLCHGAMYGKKPDPDRATESVRAWVWGRPDAGEILSGVLQADINSDAKNVIPGAVIPDGSTPMVLQTALIKLISSRPDDFSDNAVSEWIDLSSRAFFLHDLEEMEIGQEDIEFMLKRDTLKDLPPALPSDNVSLEEAWSILGESARRAGLVSVQICPASASNPSDVVRCARALDDVTAAMNSVSSGTATPGMGVCRLAFGSTKDSSGLMDGGAKPLITTASKTGFDVREVLIHEVLHAHDNILMQHTAVDLEPSWSLMSYRTDQSDNFPLIKAWVDLAKELDEIQDAPVPSAEQRNQDIMSGLVDRWSIMGLSPDVIAAARDRFVADQNQDAFLKTIVQEFKTHTTFASTADFRAAVMLAECRLVSDTLDERPVHTQMLEKMDALLVLPEEDQTTYGRGYFECVAEKMARSFQLNLSESTTKERWLVYPNASQTSDVQAAWQRFFQKDVVKQAYAALAPDNAPEDIERVSLDVTTKSFSIRFAALRPAAPESSSASLRPDL